ncbi:hypothetical protein B0A52_01183 [Exophiala mesophila]|uniref:Uncharacterized protein n=1 Tax=Exophiala mesophila TaxID=212818 RepID=A0A438NGS2_EXOME|nr:hypothetical protein B0A52_01183 [Exophiala mesophila]
MPSAPETRVEQMIHEILQQVKQQLRAQHYPPPTDVCLLADAGQTITYLLETLANVATALSEGNAATDYIDVRLEEPPQDGRLNGLDMDLVDYLEDTLAALNSNKAITPETADLVNDRSEPVVSIRVSLTTDNHHGKSWRQYARTKPEKSSVLNAVKAIEGLEVNGNETRPVNGIQQPRLLDSKSTHSSTNPSQPWSTPPVAPRRSPCRRHSRSGSCLDLRHIPVDHKYLLRSFMSPDPSDRIEHWARSKEQQSIFALHGVDETRVQGGHKVAQNTNPQATQEDTKQDHRFSLPMVGEQFSDYQEIDPGQTPDQLDL